MFSPYKVHRKTKRKKFINASRPENVEYIDMNTGEIMQMVNLIGHTEFVDSTDFVKVYDSDALMCLSLCGIRVLLYVMSELGYNERFVFDNTKCSEYVGASRHYVYRGKKELEDCDIIRKADGSYYYVNPNVIYKGNRDSYGKCI